MAKAKTWLWIILGFVGIVLGTIAALTRHRWHRE
jgi:ABC-type dipeptide/oligopeptide/nickel transport system permease component